MNVGNQTGAVGSVTVGGGRIAMQRPVAEDHDPGAVVRDTYYRSQISSVAMLRNRASGY
jgi:hypothetical protein